MSHTITDKMPIVSHDQIGTQSAIKELTAYRWFIECGGRFGTHWENVVSFSHIESPENFHLGQLARHLKAPVLMIVATNDEINGANPAVTKHVYNEIDQPKEWVDVDGGHFGLLYYPSEMFEKSSKAQIDFLKRYLES
jgi:cephalosporin-C deacetylase-like acetyl esterase